MHISIEIITLLYLYFDNGWYNISMANAETGHAPDSAKDFRSPPAGKKAEIIQLEGETLPRVTLSYEAINEQKPHPYQATAPHRRYTILLGAPSADKPIQLSEIQTRLLRTLVRNQGTPLTREGLLVEAFPEGLPQSPITEKGLSDQLINRQISDLIEKTTITGIPLINHTAPRNESGRWHSKVFQIDKFSVEWQNRPEDVEVYHELRERGRPVPPLAKR